MKAYLLVFLIACVTTWLLTPVVRRIAIAAHALTPVRDRDVHKTPIPRLGGVAMLGGFLVALLIGSRMPYFAAYFQDSQAYGVMVGAIGVCLLGVLDDLFELGWVTKLAGQCLIAGVMGYLGVQMASFPIFGVTIGSSTLSLLATVVITVVAMNAVNFVDGLDGLAAGITAIGAGCFFVYSYQLIRMTNSQSYASLAALIIIALAGICVGFLAHNFHPASIFMGDSGSMLLGLITAAGTIIVTGQIDPHVFATAQVFPTLLPILLPLAVLTIPLVELTSSVIRRLSAGQSPFHADAKHMHHRLISHGNSHTRAVLVLYAWALVVGVAALAMLRLKLWQWLTVFILMTVLATLFTIYPRLHKSGTQRPDDYQRGGTDE